MIKDKIKRFIIGHKSLNQLMFKYYRLANNGLAKSESERRKKLSLFDTEALAAHIPYSPEETIIDNNLYGQMAALRAYSSIDQPIEAYLEHGLFWGGMIHEDERHWYVPKIITYSNHRKVGIESHNTGKQIIPIGPYIHYAQNLYSDEEFARLKENLGRVLLVFPSKSILNIESRYDVDAFNKEIDKRAKEFDNVLISLYYLDIQNKQLVNQFTNRGYKIVTSGHKYDHYFINRQRTIIELADMTMGNEVGSHIGYCIYLNKPHYVFEQKLERIGSSTKELNRELKLYSNSEDKQRALEKRSVIDKFNDWRESITSEQRDIIDFYWGISSIKTADELRHLLIS